MPDDKTEELKRRVQDLDSAHDEWLRESLRYLGRILLGLSGNRVTRFLLVNSRVT
ncbi:MAG: hypothetical protein JJE48_02250 [Actinobacteria bacterium]|nr:hypothetical protein [Actinomycetota bacterium]